MITVKGWLLASGYSHRDLDRVYVVRAATVHNHPRFGSTWNYQSTIVKEFGEDENGVYADVESGKRIYLLDHYSERAPSERYRDL